MKLIDEKYKNGDVVGVSFLNGVQGIGSFSRIADGILELNNFLSIQTEPSKEAPGRFHPVFTGFTPFAHTPDEGVTSLIPIGVIMLFFEPQEALVKAYNTQTSKIVISGSIPGLK